MEWFTADTHAYHDKIVAACSRPFDTGEQMAISMASTINEHVRPTDKLFHLGDFCWGGKSNWSKFRSMINCRQIFLIRGNHDHIGLNDTHNWFASIFDIYEFANIIMCHYPFESWNRMRYGSIHLHGHCHGTLGEDITKLKLDVGVDAQNYGPISHDDVVGMAVARTQAREALRGHGKTI